MNKSFENMAENAMNERAEKLLTQRPGSNRNAPVEEAQMADKPNMGIPPSKSISEWQSIGELARKLAEKAGGDA